ncbi:MAG: glycosyltransferase family 2 protein [Chloroflexia bacterium]
MQLSIVILAVNEAQHLEGCIASASGLLAPPAGELVVVLDGRATPEVEAVAHRHTGNVHRTPFVNFSAQRNRGIELSAGDWVLFLDADERVTPELAAEVSATLAMPGDADGYWIPRRTFMFGHEVRHSGWWPDYQMRLLRRAVTRYDEARAVHEVPLVPSDRQAHMTAPLIHYNFATWREFTVKQRRYVAYEAHALREAGVRARPRNYILQPLREFRRRFITLSGWKDGPLGLLLALAMAYYNYRLYRALTRSFEF